MNKKASEMSVTRPTWAETEYSRILTAAVVNHHFCEMLLTNPDKAVTTGFAGETFTLRPEEKKRISSIRATSLADFARQLTQPQVAYLGCAAD